MRCTLFYLYMCLLVLFCLAGNCLNMSKVKVSFSNKLTKSDPLVNPVIIIGKLENLKQVPYDVIKSKLEPRVTEEVI